MAATTPDFNFDDFSSKLQKSVTKAIQQGFKDLDFSSIGDKIQKSVGRVKASRLLDLEPDLTSVDTLKRNIEELQKIRQAGGREAYQKQLAQETILAQQKGKFFNEEIQNRLKARGETLRDAKGQYTSLEKLQSQQAKFNQSKAEFRRLQRDAANGSLDQEGQARLSELTALKADADLARGLQRRFKHLKTISAAKAEDAVKEREALLEQEEAEAIRNQTQEAYLAGHDALQQKLKRLTAIMSDPKLVKTILATEGVRLLIKGLTNLRQEFDKFREEGQTITQALGGTIDSITVKSVLFGFKTGDALRAAQAELGDLSAASGEAADDMAALAATTGASAQVAGKLQASLQQLPGATQKSSVETAQFAGNLARAANVAPGKVLESMANSSEEMAKFSANGGQNFARAAVGAAKMGVEVAKIANAAESLLEFESSINKQMEASVLLGREINFDKARELAIQGDLMGATQSMLSQLGGEAEFNKMNLIQKKALAESMGMSVADMGKLVKNQGKFNEAQKEALANGQSLDEVLAMGGGFLDKWGAPVKDFAIGFLQAIPTLLLYSSNMQLAAGSTTSNTVATRINTIAVKASAAAASAWNMIKTIGLGILRMSGILWLAEKTRIILTTIATKAATAAQFTWNATKGLAIALWNSETVVTARNRAAKLASTIADGAYNTVTGIGNVLKRTAIGMWIAEKAQVIASTVAKWANVGATLVQSQSNTVLAGTQTLVGSTGGAAAGGLAAFGAGLASLAVAAPAIPVILAIGAGILMIGGAIALAAYGLSFLVASLKDIPFENLLALPISLMGVGAGLYLMAAAGLAALPILGALTALAIVAPALSGLGDALGGGGGKEKEEKEDKLTVVAQKLDSLVGALSQPVVIKLDTKVIATAMRLHGYPEVSFV